MLEEGARLTIDVTQRDINSATRSRQIGDNKGWNVLMKCPVARAAKRATGKPVAWAYSTGTFEVRRGPLVDLSIEAVDRDSVSRFVEDFDANQEVSPITFEAIVERDN